MRTLFILAFFAFALVACNAGKAESVKETLSDSTNVEETVGGDEFTSPDLTFFRLQGHVHTLKDGDTEFEFDKKGKFVKVDGLDPFQEPSRKILDDGSTTDIIGYVRNDKGYITEANTIESTTEYIWDGGKVVREEHAGEGMIGETIYTHNEDGTIASVSEKWSMEGEEESNADTWTITYSNYKKDNHGNWISRDVTTTEGTDTETRTITYYK